MNAAIHSLERIGGIRFGSLVVVAGVLFGSAAVFASPEQIPRSYFPLEVGNSWVYVLTGEEAISPASAPAERHEVRVESCQRVEGLDVFLMKNYLFRFVPADLHFFNDQLDQTMEMHESALGLKLGKIGCWYPWSRPGAGVMLPEFVLDCVHGSTGRLLQAGRVTVPAGTFDQVLTVEYFRHPCLDSGVLSESFAPGVGLIRRQVITFAGIETWSLVSVALNGGPIPAAEVGHLTVRGAPVPGSETRPESTWGAIKSSFAR
jgi:hypothetical protein